MLRRKVLTKAYQKIVDPDVLTISPPLPQRKPNLVFGYSKTAIQRQAAHGNTCSSRSVGTKLGSARRQCQLFFLGWKKFKLQATGGTHFITTNQVANVGAIAMEGTLQSARSISPEENLDFDEPQFFSLRIDSRNDLCKLPMAKQKGKEWSILLPYENPHMVIFRRWWLESGQLRRLPSSTTYWQTVDKGSKESAPVLPRKYCRRWSWRRKKRVQFLQPLNRCRFHEKR